MPDYAYMVIGISITFLATTLGALLVYFFSLIKSSFEIEIDCK